MMSSLSPSGERTSVISSIKACNTFDKAQDLLQSNQGAPLTLLNFISNDFVASSSGNWIDSFEPKTGKLCARVPNSSAEDVEAAVAAATKAFQSWSRTTRAERSKLLLEISRVIQENQETFAIWESMDQGKTLERARIEVDRAISNFA